MNICNLGLHLHYLEYGGLVRDKGKTLYCLLLTACYKFKERVTRTTICLKVPIVVK